MKRSKLLALPVALVILAGCTSNSPQPKPSTPAPSVSQSSSITEAPTVAPTEPTTQPATAEPTETQPETTKATPAPTASATSEAGTPATQFAARWGKRYPGVPEYAVLKAANATCSLIADTGDGWESSDSFQTDVAKIMDTYGISQRDGLEFAQDADQNYCASVANPT